jgi:hypothetical protein
MLMRFRMAVLLRAADAGRGRQPEASHQQWPGKGPFPHAQVLLAQSWGPV